MSVVDLSERLAARRAAEGESSFVVCPCQAEQDGGPGFHPVVHHDARGAFIAALVCAACGEALDVDGGRLDAPADGAL